MSDRLQIEISGILPIDGKYAILAAAQKAADEMAAKLMGEHILDLKVEVKSIRPGKGKAPAQAVRAIAAE